MLEAGWSTFGRVIVTRGPQALTPLAVDALANVIVAIAAREKQKLILVQIARSDEISVHRVASSPAFARYAAALRAHVEEVHGVTPGEGLAIRFLRRAVPLLTSFGTARSILYPDVDSLVAALSKRHGIDEAELRRCIARTS
jgi:hypothetical protein